ncbi:MAG: DUF1636 domain-containing protein [Rhodospirillales bacterium]
MQQPSVLRICVTCRRDRETAVADEQRDGARLYRALEVDRPRLAAAGVDLEEVRCVSGCKRACTAVLSAAEKWSYVLCDIDGEVEREDLIDYALRYAAAEDGQIPWRERPEALRRKTLARIPPLPTTAKKEQAA